MSKDEDENFHVLSNKPDVIMEEYVKLDNFVAKVLDADLSQIKKVDLLKDYGEALKEETLVEEKPAIALSAEKESVYK